MGVGDSEPGDCETDDGEADRVAVGVQETCLLLVRLRVPDADGFWLVVDEKDAECETLEDGDAEQLSEKLRSNDPLAVLDRLRDALAVKVVVHASVVDTDPVTERVCECERLLVGLGLVVPVRELDGVPVGESVNVPVAELEGVPVGETEGGVWVKELQVPVAEELRLLLSLWDRLVDTENVFVATGVSVWVKLPDGVPVVVPDTERVGLRWPVLVAEALHESDRLALTLAEWVTVGILLTVAESVLLPDRVLWDLLREEVTVGDADGGDSLFVSVREQV